MRRWLAMMLGAVLLVGCQAAPERASPATTSDAIAWREGDIDDAFAEARESAKPVLLYWGAKWCPPCNQMKATLFKDPAFIAETRAFVPVYLDGDSKGAQAWGEKFGISGYPTVIILTPDRKEITRLSSASAATTLAAAMKTAAAGARPFDDVLAAAGADPARLTAADWRMLASFDWFNDQKHFATPALLGSALDRLAGAAPTPALKRRFALMAMAAAGIGTDQVKLSPAQAQALPGLLDAILADPGEIRANRQELGYLTVPLINALPDAGQRQRLTAGLVAGLDRLRDDATLPLGDRLSVLQVEIDAAKGPDGKGPVPPALLAKIRGAVAAADRAATDPMTRQAVMPGAAELLQAAGDGAGANRLLAAELSRSVAPYYAMGVLASFAEEQNDAAAAVAWSRKAYEASQGPATRVQWAISYAGTVIRLTPKNAAAVAASSGKVIEELGRAPGDYYQRTSRKAGAWGKQLQAWAKANGGGAVLAGLRSRLAAACAGQGAGAAACRGAIPAG